METIETGKDKVKKICEVLRKETIEPAISEAKAILHTAQENADQIIEEARAKAARMIAEAEKEIDKRYSVFKTALNQGARQSVEWLRQEIEERLLHHNLGEMISKATSNPKVLSDMIKAVIKAVEEEGLETDLSAVIPSAVNPQEVNALLGKELLEKLKEKSVLLGPKKGGVEVKLHKEHITIDLSDTALLELMTQYVRKDFHQYFFSA